MPTVKDESNDDVLEFTKSLFKEGNVAVSHTVLDRAHRIEPRFNLLKKAKNHVKEIPAIGFCYAVLNCCLQVKFHDDKQEDIFFSTFDELPDGVDSEI